MSIMIGLTGPTGAGKSSLTDVAENLGFKVIDCDKAARKATEKGSDGLLAVVNTFGEDILTPEGTLNRRLLARKAFSSPENTILLNQTLLPFIIKLVLAQCGDNDVLLDAPTLFESGLNKKCDATVSVLANVDIRLERITKRDNISVNDAMLRINAGKTDEFYKKHSDFLIYNNGNEAEFKKNFVEILTNIKERY